MTISLTQLVGGNAQLVGEESHFFLEVNPGISIPLRGRKAFGERFARTLRPAPIGAATYRLGPCGIRSVDKI